MTSTCSRQNPRDAKPMGSLCRRQGAPEGTPAEIPGAELRQRSGGDAGARPRGLSMNVLALRNGAGDGPSPLAGSGVPDAMCAILERLDVGRPFSFGEAVLNPDAPSSSLQGPTLALLAVWDGSLAISGPGECRRRLDASHCGLFFSFDRELRLKPEGSAAGDRRLVPDAGRRRAGRHPSQADGHPAGQDLRAGPHTSSGWAWTSAQPPPPQAARRTATRSGSAAVSAFHRRDRRVGSAPGDRAEGA